MQAPEGESYTKLPVASPRDEEEEEAPMTKQESMSLKQMMLKQQEEPGAAEAVVEEKLEGFDYLRIFGAFILPGGIATVPVMMPFGTPFAKDGDNSIMENWAYYFWYTPIGWGAMWLKIVLWNCELWERDFFLPFMHGKPGLFQLNSTLAAVVNTTLFSVAFYVLGYLIFGNPVPIGTISFGVPCFVALFVNMYIFVVPKKDRQTKRDHLRILFCWLPFVMWVVVMVLYTCLVWLQSFLIPKLDSPILFVLANIGIQVLFIMIRGAVDMIPVESFMGDQNSDMSLLWRLGYAAICSTMSDWIFPGMPTDVPGLLSTGGVITINLVLAFEEMREAHTTEDIITLWLHGICDVVSCWAFVFVFSYNAFGPNQHDIYVIADMNHKQKVDALGMISVFLLVNVLKLVVMLFWARHKYPPEIKKVSWHFGIVALRQWYWLVTWLLISTCCACGACMVMMHDGMDFSFSFKQWAGTWPFDH